MFNQVIAIYCLCDDYLKSTFFKQNKWHNENIQLAIEI
jgi:hypothetical protein